MGGSAQNINRHLALYAFLSTALYLPRSYLAETSPPVAPTLTPLRGIDAP